MPYIESNMDSETRKLVDEAAKNLALVIAERTEDEHLWSGTLNYAVTRLIIHAIRIRFGKMRYYIWDWIGGMLLDVYYEFRRRRVDAYEDKKKAENGDVGYDEVAI
jgi:hypothetical protein